MQSHPKEKRAYICQKNDNNERWINDGSKWLQLLGEFFFTFLTMKNIQNKIMLFFCCIHWMKCWAVYLIFIPLYNSYHLRQCSTRLYINQQAQTCHATEIAQPKSRWVGSVYTGVPVLCQTACICLPALPDCYCLLPELKKKKKIYSLLISS